MVPNLSCPHCASRYDPGDKFCQDCGLPLNAAQANAAGMNRAYQNVLSRPDAEADGSYDHVFDATRQERPRRINLSNTPAEVILVVAAGAYIFSALAWCNKDSLTAVILSWRAPQAQAVSVGTTGGAPPVKKHVRAAVGNMPNVAIKKPEPPVVKAQVVPHQVLPAPVVKQAPRPEVKPLAVATVPVAIKAHVQPAVVVRAPVAAAPVAKTVPPATSRRSAGKQEPVLTPIVFADAKAEGEAESVSKKPHKAPKPEELSSLTIYNHMLANYFSKGADASPDAKRPDPPSYQEWLANKKQDF